MLVHKGVPTVALAQQVVEYIEEGYTLTIQDIANHLAVTYDYARTKIVPEVSHVVLTTYAKQACFKFFGDREEFLDYFKKRLLISKEDYNRYIVENSFCIKKNQRVLFEDFPSFIREKLINLDNKEISLIVSKVLDNKQGLNYSNVEEDMTLINEFHNDLVSSKDLFNGAAAPIVFRYDIDIHRFCFKYGIPKIKINNLVRYQLKEFQLNLFTVIPLGITKEVFIQDVIKLVEKNQS